MATPTVTITVGGKWGGNGVVGGDRRAPRALPLDDGPVGIGRDRDKDVPLPDAGQGVSGLAAIVSALEGNVKLQVVNRAGGVLFSADGNVHTFHLERDPARASARHPVLLHDGDVLWLSPPGSLKWRVGGHWLEFHLPAEDPQPLLHPDGTTGPAAERVTTVIEVIDGETTFNVRLQPAQRVILTALYAEWVVPIAGRTYCRASTSEEIAAMVWSVEEYRSSRANIAPPTTHNIQQKIGTLIDRLDREAGVPMVDDPGLSVNQRLAVWCDNHVPKQWFDVGLAARLLDGRPPRRDRHG
jgi:hypothetical protein